MKTIFRYMVVLILLTSASKCYSQLYKMGIDANSIDSGINIDDVNHSYIIDIGKKDSDKVELYSVAKYYDPGTRNVTRLDSTNHPIEFTGIKQYDDVKYTYTWKWSSKGRLLYTDVYVNGKLYRRIKMY